jgi:hypothetical protein
VIGGDGARNCIVCRVRPAKGPTCGSPKCIEAFSRYRNATPLPPDLARRPYAQADFVEDKNDRDGYAPPARERIPKRGM